MKRYYWAKWRSNGDLTIVVKYSDGWYATLGTEMSYPPESGDNWEFIKEISAP